MAMNIKYREISHLQGDEAHGWSDWIWAMAPENTLRQNNLKPRGKNREGFVNSKFTDSLRQANPNVAELCGIYEWKLTDKDGANPSVVYVGSTCPDKPGPGPWYLNNRIVAYTKHGHHKAELINDALKRGYELSVRFKTALAQEEASRMENALLGKYNYPWNIRDNGVRPILARHEKGLYIIK